MTSITAPPLAPLPGPRPEGRRIPLAAPQPPPPPSSPPGRGPTFPWLLLAATAVLAGGFLFLAACPAHAATPPDEAVDRLILQAQSGLDDHLQKAVAALGSPAAPRLAAFLDLGPSQRVRRCLAISRRLCGKGYRVANVHHPNQYDWQLEEGLLDIFRHDPTYRHAIIREDRKGWLFRAAVETCSTSDEARLVLDSWKRQGPGIDRAVLENSRFTKHLELSACLPLLIATLREAPPAIAALAASQLVHLTGRDASRLVRRETPYLNSRSHVHELDPRYCEDPATLARAWDAWWSTVRDHIRWDATAANPAGRCLSSGDACELQKGRFTW